MPLPTKFFKVTLPLATAATATIITTYLIISAGVDKDKSKEEDPALENIELKSKEFEEEIIQNDQESEKDEKSDSGNPRAEEEKEKDLEAKSPEKSKDKTEPEKLEFSTPEEAMKAMVDAHDQVMNIMEKTTGAKEADKVDITLPKNLSTESSSRQAISPEIKTEQEAPASKEQGQKETAETSQLDEKRAGKEGEDLSQQNKKEQELEAGKDLQNALQEEEMQDETVSQDMPSSPTNETNLNSQDPEHNLNEAPASKGDASEQEDLREEESETDSMQNGDQGEEGEEDLGKQEMSGSEGSGDSDSRDGVAIVTDEQLDILQNLGLQIKDKLSLLGRLVR